jgi:hypothetical protein
MDGLGGIYVAGLVIAALILLVVGVVGVLVLTASARAVRSAGPAEPPPTARARTVSTGLAVLAFAIAASPIVLTLIVPALFGPAALPSDTGFVALVALALGGLSVSAAWLTRHPAARAASGGLLVAVIVAPALIQLWVTSQTIAFATQYRANQEASELRATRYADIIDGPSVGEIVAAVGQVGAWRPVNGSVYPYLRSDEWLGSQAPIADLSGRSARFVLYVQCWVDGDPGEIYASVYEPEQGILWSARLGRCDGTMQVVVSDVIALPRWTADRIAAARSRDQDLLGVTASPIATGEPMVGGHDSAVRWVAYVSADPPTPNDALTDAVTNAAGSFVIR